MKYYFSLVVVEIDHGPHLVLWVRNAFSFYRKLAHQDLM